jgi:hypothetical protein
MDVRDMIAAMKRFVWLLAVAACGFSSKPTNDLGGDGGSADASDDSMITPGDNCYGSVAADKVCFDAAPVAPLTLDGNFDTGKPAMCQTVKSGPPNLCVVAGTTVQILALDVTGGKPLEIIATTSIVVVTHLDVASHIGGKTGPGANPSGCGPASRPQIPGSGGGAGGSYGDKGGNGGDDDAGQNGGVAGAAISPSALLGGCDGDAGGVGLGGNSGAGGAGGGAVALVAPSIQIDGLVNASGSGGSGAQVGGFHGGGGGGSGGMVVLDAPLITGLGSIVSNGGGGGGSSNGSPGHDPDPTTPDTRASGGAGGGQGGGGSGGGAGTMHAGLPGSQGTSNNGGGGGGGGVGIIKIYQGSFGGTVSPH